MLGVGSGVWGPHGGGRGWGETERKKERTREKERERDRAVGVTPVTPRAVFIVTRLAHHDKLVVSCFLFSIHFFIGVHFFIGFDFYWR